VEIIKDKTIVDSSETSGPFGIVTMDKVPNQDAAINIIINKLPDVMKP
jgi:hypothetical protein